MPTIRKRRTKKGIVYDIQVKIKEFATQKYIYKTTIWRPVEEMDAKQEEKACALFAAIFEKKMISLYAVSKIQTVNHNIKVTEYAKLWLERIRKDYSLNYYEMSIRSVEWICRYLGRYKVTDVTPNIIQSFYDELDNATYTTTTAHVKPALRKVMNEKNIQDKDFRYTYKLNSSSLANALKGKNISLEYAHKMADILGIKVESVFEIESTTKQYSAYTIDKIKKATHCIFAMAKQQLLVEHNYASADYVSYGRHPKRTIHYLDDEQAKQFLKVLQSCDDIRIKTAFIILLFTGMRRGELAGLEWKDVNFKDGTITIRRTSNYSKSCGIYTKEPKTENSIRTITVSEIVKNQLYEYWLWYYSNKKSLGDKWIETDRIFIGKNGGSIAPQIFDMWLTILRIRQNLPQFTVHSLRHTNITLQIAAGVPLTTVTGRAGHSRTSTTLDIYSHFIKTTDQQAAAILDNIFST
ncbi:MAG: site-specific integrase [Clostridia bacterium]|nr:site-specific integrase [Clostridia bacterium]